MSPLHIMIMTHERPHGLAKLLAQVSAQARNRSRSLSVVVAQSVAAGEAGHAATFSARAVLARSGLTRVVHVLTPAIEASFGRFGSKRESVRNLLAGLDASFTGRAGGYNETDTFFAAAAAADEAAAVAASGTDAHKFNAAEALSAFRAHLVADGAPTAVVVLEDDIVLSPDALAFFELAQGIMQLEGARVPPQAVRALRPAARDAGGSRANAAVAAADDLDSKAVHFATAYALARPSLLVGHAAETWTRVLAGAGGGEVGVERKAANARTVFKTLAWALDGAGYRALRARLAPMADEAASARAVEVTAAVAAAGAAAMRAPGPVAAAAVTRARGITFRAESPALRGCWACQDFCYDHAIEMTLRGRPFIAPVMPRVSQVAGAGMTSLAGNEVNAYYQGAAPVLDRKAMAAASSTAALAAAAGYVLAQWPASHFWQQIFETPGLSAMAPPLPPPDTQALARLAVAIDSHAWHAVVAELDELASLPAAEIATLYAGERALFAASAAVAVAAFLVLRAVLRCRQAAMSLGEGKRD